MPRGQIRDSYGGPLREMTLDESRGNRAFRKFFSAVGIEGDEAWAEFYDKVKAMVDSPTTTVARRYGLTLEVAVQVQRRGEECLDYHRVLQGMLLDGTIKLFNKGQRVFGGEHDDLKVDVDKVFSDIERRTREAGN